MTARVVFVHTVHAVVELFAQLCRDLLPAGTEVWHITDEILARVVVAQGGLSAFLHDRVGQHALAAEQAGATVVQLTCSSISPCAHTARTLVRIPVLTIDEPMVDLALELGSRIGIVGTAMTALSPLHELIQTRARALNRRVQVEARMAEGAYAALFGGDPEKHDAIVRSTIEDLSTRNDVVALAQASMVRVVDRIPPGTLPCRVLTSPRLALEHLAQVLAALAS